MSEHTYRTRKAPSRHGGLRVPVCSCGWEGGAAGAEQDRVEQHRAHVAETKPVVR